MLRASWTSTVDPGDRGKWIIHELNGVNIYLLYVHPATTNSPGNGCERKMNSEGITGVGVALDSVGAGDHGEWAS